MEGGVALGKRFLTPKIDIVNSVKRRWALRKPHYCLRCRRQITSSRNNWGERQFSRYMRGEVQKLSKFNTRLLERALDVRSRRKTIPSVTTQQNRLQTNGFGFPEYGW